MVNMNSINEYIEKQRKQLEVQTENIFNVLDEMQARIKSITEQVTNKVKNTGDCNRIYLQVDTTCNFIQATFYIEVNECLYDAYIKNGFFGMSEQLDRIDNCNNVLFFNSLLVSFRTEESRAEFEKDGDLIVIWDRIEHQKREEEKKKISVDVLQGYTDIFNLCVCPADCEHLEKLKNGRFSCAKYSYTLLSIQSTDEIIRALRCYICQRAISEKAKNPPEIISTWTLNKPYTRHTTDTHTTPYTDE